MTHRLKTWAWPVAGLIAVAFSAWLLVQDLSGVTAADVMASLSRISTAHYALATLCAVLAYASFGVYDRLALRHLANTSVSRGFASVTAMVAYALSHNIGAAALSGALVRYRAYTARGMGNTDVTVIVAMSTATFMLGTLMVAGAVLLIDPNVLTRLSGNRPEPLTSPETARIIGGLLLLLVALYAAASVLRLRSARIGEFTLTYPRPDIAFPQLLVAPIELLAAAAIVYFALPAETNPGYWVVLAVFVMAYSAALVSHAPGGLGVFELVFISALPEVGNVDVLAALLVFRVVFLLLPLAASLPLILLFERAQWARGELIRPEQPA